MSFLKKIFNTDTARTALVKQESILKLRKAQEEASYILNRACHVGSISEEELNIYSKDINQFRLSHQDEYLSIQQLDTLEKKNKSDRKRSD